MPDIVLKNKHGEDVTYTGIETVTFDTPSGELTKFSAGEAVEKTVDLNFIDESNMLITSDEVMLNEMLNDVSNIGKYFKYEGKTNKYIKNTYYEIISSDEFEPYSCSIAGGGVIGDITETSCNIECNAGDLIIAMVLTGDKFTLNEGWTLISSSETISSINSQMESNEKIHFAYKYATSNTTKLHIKFELEGTCEVRMVSFSNSIGYIPFDYQYATGTGLNTITVQRPQTPVVLWGIYSNISVQEWTISTEMRYLTSKLDDTSLGIDNSTETNITLTTPITSNNQKTGQNIIIAGALGIILPPCAVKAVSNVFIGDSQIVKADDGTLMETVMVNKPATLVPENIISGVNIGGIVGSYAAPKLHPPSGSHVSNNTSELNYLNVTYPQYQNGLYGKKIQVLLEDSNGDFEVVAEKEVTYGDNITGATRQIQIYASDFLSNRPISTNQLITKIVGENINDSDNYVDDRAYSIGNLVYNLKNVVLDKEYECGFYHDKLLMTITPESGYFLPKNILLTTPSTEVNSDYTYNYDTGELVIYPTQPETISVNVTAVDKPWIRNPKISLNGLSLTVNVPKNAESAVFFVNDEQVYETSPSSGTVSTPVTSPSDAMYTFYLGTDDYFTSNNKGVNNSYAICKMYLEVTDASILVLDCISYGENNYDYGLLSNLDTELSLSSSADSSDKLKQNFKGLSSSSIRQVTYNVPAGKHFIYAKYIKDGSGNNGNDTFKFKVNTSLSELINRAVTTNLSPWVTNYGAYNIGVVCKADNYLDSDMITTIIDNQPEINITDGILSLDNIIGGVTDIQIYIDDVLVDTVPYVEGIDIELEQYAQSLGLDISVKHDIYVIAMGENINENKSETIVTYIASAPVYGVSGLYSSTVALTRTDDAIGKTFTINSDGSINSDFNDIFPWNESKIVYDDAGNKFVQMPKMFFRVKTSGNYITDIAVSKIPRSDGNWYEVQSFCYGCYSGYVSSNKLISMKGYAPTTSYTRDYFRTCATANGEGYHQLDLYHLTVMRFLWWIEFATKNSESIMTGRVNGSGTSGGATKKYTGSTDNVTTPSGYETAYGQMKWHHIEDFVGNVYEWVDGVCLGSNTDPHYATNDYTKYSDTISNMNKLSYGNPYPSSGYSYLIIGLGWDPSNPFMSVGCTDKSSTFTTYFCDGYNTGSGCMCLFVGAAYYSSKNSANGLMFQNGTLSTYAIQYNGARLLYRGTFE